MGSSAPSKTTQTNKVELSPANQALEDQGSALAQQYASTPLQIPTGINVQDFNPLEVEAQGNALDVARGQMTDLANQAASTQSFLMDPSLLSPDSNPYLAQQGQAVTQTATDNLLQKILPALRSGSAVAGGFNSGGNTRYGIAEGQAVGDTNKDITNALASLYGGAYQNGLQTISGATQNNGNILKQLLYPATVVGGVGEQQRDLSQQQANANAQLEWLAQQLPFLQAQQLYSLVNGSSGNSGVSTVTGAQPQGSTAGNALGGAASGAALGSMIMPGIGTAAGAGIGGLLALL